MNTYENAHEETTPSESVQYPSTDLPKTGGIKL